MNKAEKSLRWVVNQIPDFKPTTNEEKMLLAIKLYSEAGAEEISRLEVENAKLKEMLSRVKSGRVSKLKAENAALRERLDKAIEPPCERDDIFYRFFQYPAEMVEDIACGFRKEKDGELYVCSANSESWYNVKECEFSREAAEARLKELQGEEK